MYHWFAVSYQVSVLQSGQKSEGNGTFRGCQCWKGSAWPEKSKWQVRRSHWQGRRNRCRGRCTCISAITWHLLWNLCCSLVPAGRSLLAGNVVNVPEVGGGWRRGTESGTEEVEVRHLGAGKGAHPVWLSVSMAPASCLWWRVTRYPCIYFLGLLYATMTMWLRVN